MLESKSTLLFRTVDYRVFKDGYLFKLMDTDRRTSYKLAFVPFSLHPSVLMLDFLMADVNRGATLHDDLMSMVREDLSSGSISEFIVLGSPNDEKDAIIDGTLFELGKLDKQGVLSETGDGTRIHNKKKLHKVSNVALSRDIVKELGKLSHTDIAFRIDRDKLVIDRVGSANRDYVSGLDISRSDVASRQSSFCGVVSKELGVYFRPYRKDTFIDVDIKQGKRHDVFGLGILDSTFTAERFDKHILTVNSEYSLAVRDITKGFMYTDYKPLDFYVEIIPRYLKIMRPEILASRIINNSRMTALDNTIFADRNLQNDMFIKEVIDVTRDKLKDMAIEDTILLGKKKAPQYPTHMHFVGNGDRLKREDMYLQAVGDAVRDIVGGDLVKDFDTLRFEREITNSLELLKERLQGYREEQKNKERPATIERTIITAYRDIVEKAYIEKDRPVGNRFYLVKAMVNEDRPQGARKYDNVLHLSHNQPLSSRDVTQNTHLYDTKCDKSQALRDYSSQLIKSTSELYHRDKMSGLYVPTEQQQAYRKKKDMTLEAGIDGVKDIVKKDKDTFITRLTNGERDRFKDLLLINSGEYERDSTKKLHLEYSQIYDRVKRKLMHLRDEWLDILINGGELPENDMWDAILMDDMLFGELLDSPAWIEEYIMVGDAMNSKLGVITADFLEGTKAKIQALIDSDILLSSREGDVPGEIISINYEALAVDSEGIVVEDTHTGERGTSEGIPVEYPDLMAHKVTIPKYGWLDELENPLGYLEERGGVLNKDTTQGDRAETEGHVEESEQLATRPDLHDSHLSKDMLMGGRFTKDATLDDDELMATRGDTYATVHTDSVMADRGEIEAILTEPELKSGKLWDKESTLMVNMRNLLGTAIDRATSFFSKVWMGTKADRGGFTDDSPTMGTKKDKGAIPNTDLSTMGTKVEREGISVKESETMGTKVDREGNADSVTMEAGRDDIQAEVDDSDYTGSKVIKGGIIQDDTLMASKPSKHATLEEMKYAELKGRLASAVVDFIFAQNSEKEAEGLQEIVTAVKEERAFTLMEHIEGYREERYGTIEEQLVATPEKLGDVIKGILATPEKYGIHLDGSMLGQGVLHDYNDDLLSEGNDVEGWSGGYGFGVPDDYDPLDPFNNYYPYTSDYTSHELAQAVSWTKNDDFEFKADTDIIKLSTTKDSIAVADVSGDNYKFSVDFCVKGNKDTAVDIVVRYTNEHNYYVFRINGGDRAGVLDMSDNMQLYKVAYGEYSPVGYPMSPHKWVKGTWHRVEISLLENGSKLLIKVDDRVQYDMRGY